MESIIKKLLRPDSLDIRRAEVKLREELKKPEASAELYAILANPHAEVAVRRYAQVIMMRNMKSRGWFDMPECLQLHIKATIRQVLLEASTVNLHRAVAQLLGAILKNDESAWRSEVLSALFRCCHMGETEQLCEVAAATVCTLTDVVPDLMSSEDCLNQLLETLVAVTNNLETEGNGLASSVMCHIMEAMGHVAPCIVTERDDAAWSPAERIYESCIPTFLRSLRYLATLPESTPFLRSFGALDSLELFDPKLLVNSYLSLMEFCLLIAADTTCQLPARIRCVAFVESLVRVRTAADANQPLLERIVPEMFKLICMEVDLDFLDDDSFSMENDLQHPVVAAIRAMGALAENIPSERMLPLVSQMLSSAFCSDSPHVRRAAFIIISVITEGCDETLSSDYVERFVSQFNVAFLDLPMVRSAAFFAMEVFVNELQAEINKYVNTIMPLFFQNINELYEHLRHNTDPPKHKDRMLSALESYCLHLDEALDPYLPQLMELLLPIIENKLLQKYVLKVISACVQSSKGNMLPYFEKIVYSVGLVLRPVEGEENEKVLPAAIDTIAELARYISKEHFQQFLPTTLSYGLEALKRLKNNGDIKAALFNLFAGLSNQLGTEMHEYLPKIIDDIHLTLLYDDTGSVSFCSSDSSHSDKHRYFHLDSVSSKDSENKALNTQTATSCNEEKEEAVRTLKAFAENCGPAFMPHMQKSMTIVTDLFDSSDDELRKLAAETLVAFVLMLQKLDAKEPLRKATKKIIKCFGDNIIHDEEPDVVIELADGLKQILSIPKALKSVQLRDLIIKCLRKTLEGKIKCIEDYEDYYDDNKRVIEEVFSIIPVLGVCISTTDFEDFFETLVPIFIERLSIPSKCRTQRQIQCGYACFALGHIFIVLGPSSAKYFGWVFDTFLKLMSHPNYYLRQNAAYAVSLLMLHSGEIAYPFFTKVLNAISICLRAEAVQSAKDYLCSALARVIIASPAHAELNVAIPLALQYLPILEEFNENAAVIRCFEMLYANFPTAMEEVTDKIIHLAMNILMDKRCADKEEQDLKESCIRLLRAISSIFEDKFKAYLLNNPNANGFMNALFSQ